MSVTILIDGRGGLIHSFCAMNSLSMSFWIVPATLCHGTFWRSATTRYIASSTEAEQLIVIEVDTLSSGIRSNRRAMSWTEMIPRRPRVQPRRARVRGRRRSPSGQACRTQSKGRPALARAKNGSGGWCPRRGRSPRTGASSTAARGTSIRTRRACTETRPDCRARFVVVLYVLGSIERLDLQVGDGREAHGPLLSLLISAVQPLLLGAHAFLTGPQVRGSRLSAVESPKFLRKSP